ncbi:ATP-binding protein [Ralstonia nicotianae]|nr:ATP-binding protein [Ralstonia pseudosolanacearum]MDK1382895.1 ATP-binding protein [Ralstonia pseudosolanacearum]
MFHEYRRQGKEGSKQRAINFDGDVVDRVFPAAKDSDRIEMELTYDTDEGVSTARQWLKRQDKNWRLEGNCPEDKLYSFVTPGCLFAMQVDAGKAPASGAWVVLPISDPVTQAILANGESSRLAKSAMIALHENEGEQVWALLNQARPDMFAPLKEKVAPVQPALRDTGSNRKKLPPNAMRLVSMLAEVGHTMPSAVADLVDNAINADATRIDITFGRPDAGHGRWMAIADNGHGMDADRLDEAMRIGGESDYTGNSLGKYGFGLKGASWSQAKVFTVVTKQDGKQTHHLTWDIHDMDEWAVKSEPLEAWEKEATVLDRQGTVVLWKEMRPPQSMPSMKGLDPYSSEVAALTRHLALVFHRFIEGKAAGRKPVTIRINEIPVEANNPVGHPLASAYDTKTIRIPTEDQDGKVQVQAFLLPTEDAITAYHESEGPAGVRRALERIGLYGKRNETQGLFIYRHDRLIKWGGWAQMWETNDEKTKLARVVVDFNKVLDDPFKINISKQSVQLPQQLQAEIKKLADVARKDSQKQYRKTSRAPAPTPAPIPAPSAGAGSDTTGGTKSANGALGNGGGTAAPSPAGSGSAPAPSSTSSHRVSAKEVKTNKFVWKVSTSLAGTIDVQVSDINANLRALIKQIGSDQQALIYLAGFLSGLDHVDTQQALLAQQQAVEKEA